MVTEEEKHETKARMKEAEEQEEAAGANRRKWELGASSAKDIALMDEMEDRLEDAGLVRAPDGGYGWAVVFASFCTNAIVDGVIFTVSASLVPRWEKFFDNSGVTAATSLLAGFYLLSGPLASALANNFGCNTVAIAGSLVAALGFLISALLPALPILYFAFGIIGGIGYGLIFLPAIVIVGQYFSERRALATGIAVCGSGIGTAVFGKINPILLSKFDALAGEDDSWRLFLLFLAAVTLFCALFGYFFRPLKPSKAQIEQVVRITSELMGMEENAGGEKPALMAPITSTEMLSAPSPARKESEEDIQSPHVTQGVEIERFNKPTQNGAFQRKRRDTFSQRPFLSTLELLTSKQAIAEPSVSNANLAMEISKAGITNLNRPLSRMDIFYAGSTTSLANRIQRNSISKRPPPAVVDVEGASSRAAGAPPATMRRSTLYLSSVGLSEAAAARTAAGLPSKWSHALLASLRPMLDLSLLRSPTFLVLALSGFLTLFCFFVPFAFIGALADERVQASNSHRQHNLSALSEMTITTTGGTAQIEETTPIDDEQLQQKQQHPESNERPVGGNQLLLVLLGLFNVFGRVLCGFVSDHPKVDPLALSNSALIIGGLATFLVPLFNQFWMFALYCLPFAFGAASFAALRSIICVELLGIDRLSSAFGMLMLFMGVAALLGPPFARVLKDWTGSYGLSFHIMGVLMALSGLLGVPLRRIREWENVKEEEERKENEDKNEVGELEPLNNGK